MSNLAHPQSRVLAGILKSRDFSRVFVFLLFTGLLTLTLGTSGCSSFNAGSTNAGPQNGAIQKIVVSPTLPDATVGTSYNAAVSVTGGTPPYRFMPVPGQGSLPSGLTLNPFTGVVSGSAKASGTFAFMLFVTDQLGQSGVRQRMALTVVTPPAAAPSLTIASETLPDATQGTPYSASLHASGGKTPYSWKIASGSLPGGFALDPAQGGVSGLTSQSGTYSFMALVTDAAGASASQKFSIGVQAASTGNFDGPAELPRVTVKSTLTDTPAPGAVHPLKSGDNLQTAINSAKCGDTISLAAGAVFQGTFLFPAKSCDDGHWIVIRSSAADSALPPEGTRLTPCYAGVAALPGRPAYPCSAPKNVLPTITFPGSGSGPIVFANGANHFRFVGVEITRSTPKAVVYNLVVNEKDGTADHIIFDRTWIHGTAQDETTRGIMLSGTTYAAVVDSYISDFHCVAVTGACGDAQAIGGGTGNSPMGPYKVENNFMEGAAETIIFGGDGATVTPTDIEVRRNHMFKPATWMKGNPSFAGGWDGNPFIVKNLFELKNAQRVLLEGNILENTWGGFSQVGFAILLTPKNQASGTTNVCPMCLVTDVTIRYNVVRHTGAGMQIGNGVSSNGGLPRDGERYSIHDMVFDDMNGKAYAGTGVLAQVSMSKGVPVLQHVRIDHTTALTLTTLLVVGDNLVSNAKMNDFTFTNNLVNAGAYPLLTADGGAQDCVYHMPSPSAILDSCFTNYQFSHNAITGLPKSTPATAWPTGNWFPGATLDLGGGAASAIGNFLLPATSPYKNAGTDGKDPGADIAALAAAIAGVQ